MSCAAFDKAFRMAEQQISDDIIKKKMKLAVNAYWGRIPDKGDFPLHSGTRIKKIRLSRIGFGQMETGWENVVDNGCFSNICSDPPAEVISHGSDESFYSLEKFKIATDPFCLTLLKFRQIGEQELLHLEDSIKTMAAYFWDEYLRSRYINACENKYVAMVSDAALDGNDYCNTLERQCNPFIEDSNGFIFWNRGPTGPVLNNQYAMDERYVSVNVPYANIKNISELSGDLLQQASLNLQYESDNMPFVDEGINVWEVIVPDPTIMQRLVQLERIQESSCSPLVIYPDKDLSLRLGIKKIIRDQFGIRWDRYGMKFFADDVYNSSLGAYSSNDPATWPRFVRVFAYVPAKNANGTMKYIPNKNYQKAPFGISVIFTPTVMGMRSHPEATSVGSATVGESKRDFSGSVKWVNEYDKQCNPYREIGHWELHFGAGIEPDRPENGNAFFHRIDHSVSLSAVRCTPPILGCGPKGFTIDCYDSVQSGETITAGSLGANTVSSVNNYRWFM